MKLIFLHNVLNNLKKLLINSIISLGKFRIKFNHQADNFNTKNEPIKYVIYTDWISSYLTQEPFTFVKNLEILDWKIIKLSDLDIINIINIKKNNCIVFCVTYDDFDISLLKCDNVKIIYKIDDLYPYKSIRNKCIKNADILISPCEYLLKTAEINKLYKINKFTKSFHIPYSAVDHFFENIEFNNNPINKILISGAISDVYPLRKFARNNIIYKEYIHFLDHPNYKNYTHDIINELNYKKINEYLCCFVDASTYNYILLKVFETCSVGSLLLIDDNISVELNKLGFYDRVNCIFFNKDNLKDNMEWILNIENRHLVNNMRQSGMNLVRQNHTTKIRSEQLNMITSGLIKNENQLLFENIYKKKIWNNGNPSIPLSGPGSSLANAKKCADTLNEFIFSNNCNSVLDIGCGDLTWMSRTLFFNNKHIKYTGIDIVESLINSHILNYPDKIFTNIDITKYKIKENQDIIIIRDVIFHLTNEEILSIFDNIKNKFKFILITSCVNEVNLDSFDKWHFSEKNIHRQPFNKSFDFLIQIHEANFNRNVYIYKHDSFYSL
jgi:2-polyprenyl-3-methyl-5-hydroxy-6-metoxy-1,4-benzoquinol methylase